MLKIIVELILEDRCAMFSLIRGYRVSLLSEPQLDEFKDNYKSVTGDTVETSFLKRKEVFGVFFHGEMVGGFVVDHSIERYSQIVGKEAFNSHILPQLPELKTVSSVACIWRFKKVVETGVLLWLGFIQALSLFPEKTYFVGGAQNEKVYNRYNQTKPQLVYYGQNVNNKKQWLFYNEKESMFKKIYMGLIVEYYKYFSVKGKIPLRPVAIKNALAGFF